MSKSKRRLLALTAISILLISGLIYRQAFAESGWTFECYWHGGMEICYEADCYKWKSCDYQGWTEGNCLSGEEHENPYCLYEPGEEYCVNLEAWCPILE